MLENQTPKLGNRAFKCVFIGYSLNSITYRFLILDTLEVIESVDVEFFENQTVEIPLRSSSPERSMTNDINDDDYAPAQNSKEVSVQDNSTEQRRSKRARIEKDYGPDFITYLVEGSKDEVLNVTKYVMNVDDDPKTYSEAMSSRDSNFQKEAINDEMNSIMLNQTWVLTDLPPGAKPIGCKWIFKKKLNTNGSIDKFKARLVEGI